MYANCILGKLYKKSGVCSFVNKWQEETNKDAKIPEIIVKEKDSKYKKTLEIAERSLENTKRKKFIKNLTNELQ